MKKFIVSFLMLSSFSVFADNATSNEFEAFQKFDNQVSLGMSFTQATLANGANNQALQQDQFMSLDVEHQFDNGIWADLNAYMMTSTNSLGNHSVGTGMGYGMPASQEPNLGGFNAKLGYSFPASQTFMITPYATLGRNMNLAMSTILANGQANATNDFFYTAGLGARAQFVVNKYIDIYLDQSWAYNWDQSGPLYGVMPQNNSVFTTTLGAKFNVWRQLQLGVGLFYNNFQYDAVAPNTTTLQGGSVINGGNGSDGGTVSVYQPQYSFGGMVSVGMTF
ncbi:MAG: hypothetical protein ACK5Z5_04735 [Neisseriaceae bacterium]|jgi:hypothetical protein